MLTEEAPHVRDCERQIITRFPVVNELSARRQAHDFFGNTAGMINVVAAQDEQWGGAGRDRCAADAEHELTVVQARTERGQRIVGDVRAGLLQLGRPSGKIHHPVIVTARPASDPSSPGGAAAVSSGGSYAATQPSRFCTSERWVDPTLQHKNHVEILVDGPEIVVRPVGTCQG